MASIKGKRSLFNAGISVAFIKKNMTLKMKVQYYQLMVTCYYCSLCHTTNNYFLIKDAFIVGAVKHIQSSCSLYCSHSVAVFRSAH